MAKIKVLIIDDSAVVRQTLTQILQSDEDIEVIGAAQDPFVAAEKLRTSVPDVITLDVEMPRMDGLTFLKKIMSQHPIPVVMCSSLTVEGSDTAMKALEYGAVDIITKPKMGTKSFLEESRIHICDAVKAAAMARLSRYVPRHAEAARAIEGARVSATVSSSGAATAAPAPVHVPAPAMGATATGHDRITAATQAGYKVPPKLTADAVLPPPDSKAMIQTTEKVVVVGASTGGTEALRVFLEALPANAPGMVIVQHMPEHFTSAFANRLNSLCQVTVKEAANEDSVVRGRVLIAPGNKHTLLKRSGARYLVEVKDGPLVSRHRPSVDVLFRSAARYAGKNAVGVIMTGMGDDGARGMLEMKQAGATNIAQDEQSCVVFGMPKEAIKHGGVDIVKPLDKIAAEVIRLCS
ncbi:protein-glutamate methylesterase/protein-glutamine glutaminase [Candidatus Magnetaquicoccus inordinatus]|uniref:protein-glutamate methylesterase/protein-glutamine glutaminase n=1 Tax=Candidatus Magnetaquicoccus inordinatus TaxID=2496818 RepID=UPI00102C1378|nr:chemotaxis response regulator protein-glutamate methylesterase [Candidatus Magnetaquicoccus inordinatus]